MIPRDYITEWRSQAPWIDDAQVEQDLAISRALLEIYSDPRLDKALAFRGGTALYKLYLRPPARYSEDIDLVQVNAEPAGPIMEAVRELLDPWLGAPQYRQSRDGITFRYRFQSEGAPSIPVRLKIEINTREHFSVSGFREIPFEVSSRWFEGNCTITSYDLNELLGTKLRALYQRKKGRDLFDLAHALQHPSADPDRIIEAFKEYMRREGHRVTRTDFESNLSNKLLDGSFTSDIAPLLASGHGANQDAMAEVVSNLLIGRLAD